MLCLMLKARVAPWLKLKSIILFINITFLKIVIGFLLVILIVNIMLNIILHFQFL